MRTFLIVLIAFGCGAKTGLPFDGALFHSAPFDSAANTEPDASRDVAAPAIALVPLFPTGVDDNRRPLRLEALDPHWQVSLSEAGPYVPARTSPTPGTTRSPLQSNGIVHPSQSPTNANAFYRTQIVLPSNIDPARTVLEFDVGYDNWIVDVSPPRTDLRSPDYPYPGNFFMRINGVWSRVRTGCSDAPFVGRAHYNTMCHVRLEGGNFRFGQNVLEIWVMNFDGPYGLRVESVATIVSP